MNAYYGANDYRDYLAHYGVVGMHWGIRRYQPYDVKPRGSGKGGKFIGNVDADRKAQLKAKKKDAYEAKRNVSLLSDEELSRRVKRFENEKKLKQYTDEKYAPKRTATKNIVKRALASLGNATLKTASKAAAAALVPAAITAAKIAPVVFRHATHATIGSGQKVVDKNIGSTIIFYADAYQRHGYEHEPFNKKYELRSIDESYDNAAKYYKREQDRTLEKLGKTRNKFLRYFQKDHLEDLYRSEYRDEVCRKEEKKVVSKYTSEDYDAETKYCYREADKEIRTRLREDLEVYTKADLEERRKEYGPEIDELMDSRDSIANSYRFHYRLGEARFRQIQTEADSYAKKKMSEMELPMPPEKVKKKNGLGLFKNRNNAKETEKANATSNKDNVGARKSRIKALQSSGLTYEEIAKKLGISPGSVSYYLNN